jgi:microcystin-dependent protein
MISRYRVLLLLVLVVSLTMVASVPASAQEPFLGEIRYVAFNFAPQGWAQCNGQILPIAGNQALFSLLGTYFGGDGVQTFALPDMRGRVPVASGQGVGLTNRNIGDQGGKESVALTIPQLPAHRHPIHASSSVGNSKAAAGNVPATNSSVGLIYSNQAADVSMDPKSSTSVGQNQPHENMQPYLGMTCIIALQGIYPSRN